MEPESSVGLTHAAELSRHLVDEAPPPTGNGGAAVERIAGHDLTGNERRLIADLRAVIAEHAQPGRAPVDLAEVERAFAFAAKAHVGQQRKSGEDFIAHPVGVAKICAGLGLDTETLCAALLHDTVEDTSASLEVVTTQFGETVAALVDGVTKLTGISFQSRDDQQAENYRKMIVAMAQDVRVILIKLADRLHNMRTIGAMTKQKQIEKSRETLEIFAPLAHRLGIHAIKWELEDLAFQALHPRKYTEIKMLVNQQRQDRERYVEHAGNYLIEELDKVGIAADISGRAKHFYSIYTKMARKGREFNEIYDLTAMRVIVAGTNECYGALGVVHALWKPLPGRFKDYIAMPKANLYQSLHTTVVGPEGRPLEIQIRTAEMHARAEFGVAAHWAYKADGTGGRSGMLGDLAEVHHDHQDPREFMESLKRSLFGSEVFIFTPKGDVKSLEQGATPLDFAYEVHTEIGHRTVGAKVNQRLVPLHYELKNGDIVEILTSKQDRGPSRDWLKVVRTSRARNKIKHFFKQESRHDSEHRGREVLQVQLKRAGLPSQKIVASAMLADVSRELGFEKAEDFYLALGNEQISPQVAVNKLIDRFKGDTAEPETPETTFDELIHRQRRRTQRGSKVGIRVEGVDDVMVRLAKCCRPVPGDEITGYISLGRGITIHRDDCPNAMALRKNAERFVTVTWEGENETAFLVEIEVNGWDRHRLLEDLSRTFSEHGVNIIEARCTTTDGMTANRFVVEVPDPQTLKNAINKLRQIDSVFDAYRIIPGQNQ
ncbi:MAG: bifunctional (p)ppGpp synthetase/guanosine-3',5'-bis(diphosphate) 3'-pyrophosphohydrolase [Solirubrobacteraceae bacterium]|nr:bifunctional (p)ppGpp synthetase/guanosine-3',5'-bis(diphosphate) 3'-pyrophosphohydrolase [Solirubrobacteraceae bacterium]